MEYIETSFNTPEENIAFDELLLREAEQCDRNKTLRLWEFKDYAVILGRGASFDDVFISRCRKDRVKIIKRISGGGAVLLGKGCLNYSLILDYNTNKTLFSVKNSYKYILGGITDGFCKKGIKLEHRPISDLSFRGRKVSGSAQARRKKFLLHHGTFLYNFDIDRVGFYLKEPENAPEYRNGRNHKDFLRNLPLSAAEIKEIMKSIF